MCDFSIIFNNVPFVVITPQLKLTRCFFLFGLVVQATDQNPKRSSGHRRRKSESDVRRRRRKSLLSLKTPEQITRSNQRVNKPVWKLCDLTCYLHFTYTPVSQTCVRNWKESETGVSPMSLFLPHGSVFHVALRSEFSESGGGCCFSRPKKETEN